MTDNTDSVAQCRIDYEKKKMAELIFANEEMKIQLEEREDDLLAATQRAQKADALEEENLTLRQANSELRIQLEEKKKQHEALERANANMASVMSLIQQMNVRVAAIGERQDHLADHHQRSGEESRDDQLRALTSQCESLGTQLNQWMAQSGESGEHLPQELETMKEECVQLRASLQMEKHEHRCAQQRVHELKDELARLETTHAAKFQALHQQHQQTDQENKTRMDAQADQNAELLSQLALLQYARDASPSASGDQQTLRVGSSASMTETMEVDVDEHRSVHSLHQVRETMQQRMDILASSDQNSLPKAEVIALVQEMLDAQEAYSNTMQSEMFIHRIQAKEREESLRKYVRRVLCEKLNLEKLLKLNATDAHAAHVAATPPRHGQAAEAHRQNTTTNAEMHDLWSRTPPRVQQHEDPSNSSVYELWRTHTTASIQHADAQVRCPDCLFPQARGRTTCEACHHAL